MKGKRMTGIMLAGALAVTSFAGCMTVFAEDPVTVTSVFGDQEVEITYEKAPERVVSLAGFATEMLLALGLEDRIVGYAWQDNDVLPQYQEAFEQCCEAVGMTCDVYDPNWDQSTQDGYVDQAINEQPDAIVLIPVSADHAAQQFKKINDAGIPAFCSNTLPEASAMNQIMAYTGPNDWAQMRKLASTLGEAIDGKGGVCYITHNVGTSPYYARTFGPMSTLASEYPDIKHLDVQSPGFEATAVKQVVSDWITKYGDELNAIVLADDSDQAIGAVEACKAAGRDDIVIVAAGISKQGAELIQSGDIKMASYQSCQADAGLAVRTVAEYFCGEKIARVSYLATDVIDADNVEEFLPCQW